MNQLPLLKLFSLVFAECRGAWRRFVFLIVCLAIGVAAVMTIKSFTSILTTTIEKEAKSLLAADIEIRSSWEQGLGDIEFQKQVLPLGSEFLFIKEMKAMAQYAKNMAVSKRSSLLIELKSIPLTPQIYPMYGKLETCPDSSIYYLLSKGGAVVEPSFLIRTGLQLGDSFQLGKAQVTIAGEIIAEPGRITRFFSIGPRVMISSDTLAKTNLVRPGSRVRHRTLVRLPHEAELKPKVRILKEGLADKTATVRTYKDMQSSLSTSINQIGKYLSCVGVIALLIGGVGVAMIVRTFIASKLDTIAILNCVGATSSTILKIYLLQSFLMGLIGSLLGVSLGYALQYFFSGQLKGLLNVVVEPKLQWMPVAQSLALGLLTTILFCIWPLTQAVKTRPLRLFRYIAEGENLKSGSHQERWSMGIGLISGLALIVFWQAGSFRQGMLFLLALAASTLTLAGFSWVFLKTLRNLPVAGTITLRYGIANLYRPNSQASLIITALGVGIMLVLTIHLVQLDMIEMLKGKTEINPPNYFFVDIQPDQEGEFIETLDNVIPGTERSLTPLVRSRFYSLDGRKLGDWKFKHPRDEHWMRREFVLTYNRETSPPKDNEVITGKWWDKQGSQVPQVSIEEDAARRWGASIGSILTMNIQGVKVSAPVTSIRRVNWRNMRTNFYVIFSPAALEGAPVTSVAAVHVPPGKELGLQQAVVEAMPNVTAISTNDILRTGQGIIDKLIALVDFMSVFSIMAGLLILSGAVVSTKFRRLKESAILKILGAQRGMVVSILGFEYAGLGFIAALIGVGLSLVLSWAIMEYLVKAPWHLHFPPLAAAFFLAMFLTILTGILSSMDVLKNKPLQILREVDG